MYCARALSTASALAYSGQEHILFSNLCGGVFDMLLKQEMRTYADSDFGRVAHFKLQL